MKILGEVWARRASARTNQHKLTTSAKKVGNMKEV
jgi:hypothetical protein